MAMKKQHGMARPPSGKAKGSVRPHGGKVPMPKPMPKMKHLPMNSEAC